MRSTLPPYREIVYHPIWLTFPPVLTCALDIALHGTVEDGDPTLVWTWDVI